MRREAERARLRLQGGDMGASPEVCGCHAISRPRVRADGSRWLGAGAQSWRADLAVAAPTCARREKVGSAAPAETGVGAGGLTAAGGMSVAGLKKQFYKASQVRRGQAIWARACLWGPRPSRAGFPWPGLAGKGTPGVRV